ncbi:MAG: outer membrane lipoprotein carrier protein LolA [Pseudomonadota bacterium]|nr:outer membrane lipoprotein carrier protein LolA [Pseudomonadota bacterium]
MMKRTISALSLVLALIVLSAPSRAEYLVTSQDKADIARVEKYLNSVESLRSKFIQLSSGGRFAEGNIYIERPKKMRLEYTRPSNIQVYANGFWIAHVDTELETVSHAPLELTPAGLLVRDRIELSGKIIVRRITRSSNMLSIEIVQVDEPESGKFVMTFTDTPIALRKWVVTDAQGVSTSITLVAPEFNVAIPHRLFVFDENMFERELQ